MNTKALPLCGPPGYEYQTTGPWFVCHLLPDDRAQAWVMWTLDSAILRFWIYDDTVTRKVMVDALGITVLGTDTAAGYTQMVGCRPTCEATLGLVRRTKTNDVDMEAEILSMIDMVQLNDGQVL